MFTFNTYMVYDTEGDLIAHDRPSEVSAFSDPIIYFRGLSPAIQNRAVVMIVLQESGFVARYRVTQPRVPTPTLGPREALTHHYPVHVGLRG